MKSNFIDYFENNVRSLPDATALIYSGKQYSYSQVACKVATIERFLRKLNLQPRSVIGVLLHRSIHSVVSFVATQKLGCIYLPLDPDLPVNRINLQIKDAAPAIILTNARTINLLPEYENLLYDVGKISGKSGSDTRNEPGIAKNGASRTNVSNNPGYIIYTSGSTGIPKGVLVNKKSINNFLEWRLAYFKTNHQDRFVFKAPPSFDMSISEMMVPLASGGALVIVHHESLMDMETLRHIISKYGITRISITPSMLSTLLEYWKDCKTVRDVVSGGEKLPLGVVKKFFSVAGDCLLHNIYGPTETTLAVSCYTFNANKIPEDIPIGKPIKNVKFMVDHESSGTGNSGELLIGGICLSAGYINNESLNKERFVDVFDMGISPTKFYRTGDMVRKLPNGHYVFIGRDDQQVKVNGNRIELGDIEAAIDININIDKSCVVVNERADTLKTIVAYLVKASGVSLADSECISDLKSFLAKNLPDYMMPAQYYVIEKFPLLRNGKIDRKKLKNLFPGLPKLTSRVDDAPSGVDDTSSKIRIIWARILFLDESALSDETNFFSAGGSSLSIVNLHLLLETEFGINIEFKRLLKNPTLGEMTSLVNGALK